MILIYNNNLVDQILMIYCTIILYYELSQYLLLNYYAKLKQNVGLQDKYNQSNFSFVYIYQNSLKFNNYILRDQPPSNGKSDVKILNAPINIANKAKVEDEKTLDQNSIWLHQQEETTLVRILLMFGCFYMHPRVASGHEQQKVCDTVILR